MDSIKIKIGFGKETAVFSLKVLTVAEENRLRQNFIGLTEAQLEEKNYELSVAGLTAHATDEVVVTGENGEEKKLAVADYFKDRTPASERIAHYVYRAWLVALQPSLDFI